MDLRPLTNRVKGLLPKIPPHRGRSGVDDAASHSPAEGLVVLRHTAPTGFQSSMYQPLVCLILQGSKETTVGDQTVTLSAGRYVVVSHDLPVVARITKASRAVPYLALVIWLDLLVLRSLYAELGDAGPATESARSLTVTGLDERTGSVIERYLDVLDDPVDARVLGPLVRKELHYRLLRSESGGMLRALLHRDSHASRISTAIQSLRERFRDPIEVGDLARSVGMSTSSFHKHFKSVTRTTPLRYQKELRLQEARRLLRAGRHSVSTTAFEVGYESPSQFSREYARKYGAPPQTDLLRA